MKAMSDIGKFRTIDLNDLASFVYGGDQARMRRDIEHVGEHGLVEQKTVFRAHKTPREVVTLSKQGYRLLQRAGELPTGQRAYHGFVKAREINHDADLYNMYQREADAIRERGGIPGKVRLDFELKAAVQREKNRIKDLPEQEQREQLSAFADGHGLTVRGMTIQVPDVQMEYETREGDRERANLELVSENYRGEGIRSKADAGFQIYARGNDATRVRRALEDTRTVERILSI
jgi:hypothetical protein